MDKMTAYRILNIEADTDIKEISKKYGHFVKLYKNYLMGYKIHLSVEELEKIKEAYEYLLYPKIGDKELRNLYPYQKETWLSKIWYEKIWPFIMRHKTKLVYTAVMCLITFLIITIIKYQPIDLKIIIFAKSPQFSYEYMLMDIKASELEREILYRNPLVKRPSLKYRFYDKNSIIPEDLYIHMWEQTDIYIMEYDVFKSFIESGIKFSNIGDTGLRTADNMEWNPRHDNAVCNPEILPGTCGVFISKDSYLYGSIDYGNVESTWVAVLSPNNSNKEKAIRFIKKLNKFL
jgi:hypothetical protein